MAAGEMLGNDGIAVRAGHDKRHTPPSRLEPAKTDNNHPQVASLVEKPFERGKLPRRQLIQHQWCNPGCRTDHPGAIKMICPGRHPPLPRS
jgi:hypothetical protein